jgi:type VI secretion system protein ImpM
VPDAIGLYGKLPAHGDFVDRHLPSEFIVHWDQWLQESLTASASRLGPAWIDYYLTAPMWRFALTNGCVDNKKWLGILLPSVDSVGRYFPLTFALPLPADSTLTDTLFNNSEWFNRLEAIALACLHEQPDVEAIMHVIHSHDMPIINTFTNSPAYQQQSRGIIQPFKQINSKEITAEHLPIDIHDTPAINRLKQLLGDKNSPLSLWHSKESDTTESHFFYTTGLPDNKQFASMLSGFTI